MRALKKGDTVKWIYRHWLNSLSSTKVTKTGIFLGEVKHTVKYSGKQLAVVQFEGNKKVSRVPLSELK